MYVAFLFSVILISMSGCNLSYDEDKKTRYVDVRCQKTLILNV